MKNIYTIIWGLLLTIVNANGQNLGQSEKIGFQDKRSWKLSELNIAFGIDGVRYDEISYQGLMAFAKNPEELQRDLSNMEESISATTAGLVWYAGVTFAPLERLTGNYKENQELRLGLMLHSAKEAMISYKDESRDTSIVYCNLHSEIAADVSYLFKGDWGKRWVWSIGAGVNTGLTFGNEMILMSGRFYGPGEHPTEQETMTSERYDARMVYYLRGYIPYGIHYSVDDCAMIGLEARSGIGLQAIQGGDRNFMKNTTTLMLSVKYEF